jgi:hypothetical protein
MEGQGRCQNQPAGVGMDQIGMAAMNYRTYNKVNYCLMELEEEGGNLPYPCQVSSNYITRANRLAREKDI